MFIIIGWVVVFACVLGGFVSHGGKIGSLIVPNEYVIIIGMALGALLAACTPAQFKRVINGTIHAFKAKDKTKEEYLELIMCLFEICKTGRANLLGLEEHVENPENSEIFKRYPSVLHNHHAIHFICDTLKVQISSPLSPFDLEELMDADLKAMHTEEELIPASVTRTADALPGIGIVAAVLGIVITMGKLSEGREVIGMSVASALVGTFLGVFLAYGLVQPLAARITNVIADEGKYMDVIKVCLLAFAKDASPKVCIEFSRRTIPNEVRPSFKEVDESANSAGKKAA